MPKVIGNTAKLTKLSRSESVPSAPNIQRTPRQSDVTTQTESRIERITRTVSAATARKLSVAANPPSLMIESTMSPVSTIWPAMSAFGSTRNAVARTSFAWAICALPWRESVASVG